MTAKLLDIQERQQQHQMCDLPAHMEEKIKRYGGNCGIPYRLISFLKDNSVQSERDMDYMLRCKLCEELEKSQLAKAYKESIVSIFDRIKIESLPVLRSAGNLFSITQSFFRSDQIFLLYVPNRKKAESFRKVYNKEELLWDFCFIKSEKLKEQSKRLLCHILNMDIPQKRRRRFLEPLKRLVLFCDKYGIDDMEIMETADEKHFILFMSNESNYIKREAGKIISFARRELFLSDVETNWNANIWFIDRFQLSETRINPSAPVRRISFMNVENVQNRRKLQEYIKYQIGITDHSIADIRCRMAPLTQFLQFLDSNDRSLAELTEEDLRQYTYLVEKRDIQVETYNGHIKTIREFLEFLYTKQLMPATFIPMKRLLKKTYAYHIDRFVPESVIAAILDALPEFPKELQVMYMILFTTGIRKSELCVLRADAFYQSSGESWMRVYQSKMKKEKVIPVPQGLVELVREYADQRNRKGKELLFQNKNGEAYNGQYFSENMKAECKKHGIHCGDYIFRAHDYRHGIATYLHRHKVSIQAIREYLGHQNMDMTKQYIDQMPEYIAKKQERYFEAQTDCLI